MQPPTQYAAALRELLTRVDELQAFAHSAPIDPGLYRQVERAVDRLGDAIVIRLHPLEQQLARELLAAPLKGESP